MEVTSRAGEALPPPNSAKLESIRELMDREGVSMSFSAYQVIPDVGLALVPALLCCAALGQLQPRSHPPVAAASMPCCECTALPPA